MNRYAELKDRQQKEVDAFPMMFAFSRKQFDEGMKRLGLEPTDTDKIYSLGNGGFIRKTDSDALSEMLNRLSEEMEKAIAEDTTGEGFIYDMFCYELSNHEYSYTHDVSDTLDCLGLTMEKVNADERLLHGLKKAMRRCR
mgnify:CR=1 FL=1